MSFNSFLIIKSCSSVKAPVILCYCFISSYYRINIRNVVNELIQHAKEWKRRLAERLLDLTRETMFDLRKNMVVRINLENEDFTFVICNSNGLSSLINFFLN